MQSLLERKVVPVENREGQPKPLESEDPGAGRFHPGAHGGNGVGVRGHQPVDDITAHLAHEVRGPRNHPVHGLQVLFFAHPVPRT